MVHPIGSEHHRSQRAPWLRAAVLGANDGILSTAALVIGVAAARTGRNDVLIAGIAALVAGALSMAVGEYVSVSSQRDAEEADLAIEAEALRDHPRGRAARARADLRRTRCRAGPRRASSPSQLMAQDELGAHARDELGITELATARPVQAAWTSALAFTVRRDLAGARGVRTHIGAGLDRRRRDGRGAGRAGRDRRDPRRRGARSGRGTDGRAVVDRAR